MTNWQAYIDWATDSSFDGDDIFSDVIEMTWVLGIKKAYQSVCDESTCQIVVDNTDGKYSPENTAGQYYGQLLPQRPVKIMAGDVTLWRGWLEKVVPEWKPSGERTGKTRATLHCIGAKQFLQAAQVNLPLQEDKRGDQIIAEVLRRVVLPPALGGNVWILGKVGFSELGVNTRLANESDYSDLEIGTLTFPFYGDIVADNLINTGLAIIKDVTDAERGRFFFDRIGKAVWWNQGHIIDDPDDDAVVDSEGELGIRPYQLQYRYGEGVSNAVEVSFYPRRGAGATITLWSLDHEVTIPAMGRVDFEAPYTDANNLRAGATNAEAANVSFSAGAGSVSVNGQADRALVTVQNNGAINAVLDAMDITGQALTARNRMVVRLQDDDSVAAYGLRGEQKLDLKALEAYDEAYDVADFELRRRKDPRGEVSKVTFLNQSDDIQNEAQLTWQIGYRIRINLPELGHNAPYIIIGEEHQVSEGGKSHKTTFNLEPAFITRLASYHKSNCDADVNLQYDEFRLKTRLAQQFEVSASKPIGSARIWIRKVGAPTGNLTVKIMGNHLQGGTWELGVVGASELGTTTVLAADADYPDDGAVLATSGAVAVSGIETAYRFVTFDFPTPPDLTISTKYWLVLETTDSTSLTDYLQWGADGSSPSYANGYMMSEEGASWKLQNKDAIFEVYEAI